jgi:hypothetical protein
MKTYLIRAVAVTALISLGAIATPQAAMAKSDKAMKAQLQECKKLADPKAKDECVKKAGKGAEKAAQAKKKGASKKADKAAKKAKGKKGK